MSRRKHLIVAVLAFSVIFSGYSVVADPHSESSHIGAFHYTENNCDPTCADSIRGSFTSVKGDDACSDGGGGPGEYLCGTVAPEECTPSFAFWSNYSTLAFPSGSTGGSGYIICDEL